MLNSAQHRSTGTAPPCKSSGRHEAAAPAAPAFCKATDYTQVVSIARILLFAVITVTVAHLYGLLEIPCPCLFDLAEGIMPLLLLLHHARASPATPAPAAIAPLVYTTAKPKPKTAPLLHHCEAPAFPSSSCQLKVSSYPLRKRLLLLLLLLLPPASVPGCYSCCMLLHLASAGLWASPPTIDDIRHRCCHKEHALHGQDLFAHLHK